MRIGGLILFALFLIPTVIGYCLLPFAILINPGRMKEATRSVDQFNNAFWLNGSGRESVSSHSWRDRCAWWSDFVIWLTDKIQAGHCKEANRHEQPIQDFINQQK
jgi:hypothetical protein